MLFLGATSFFNSPVALQPWMMALFLALPTVASLITVLGLNTQDWQQMWNCLLGTGKRGKSIISVTILSLIDLATPRMFSKHLLTPASSYQSLVVQP